MDRSALAPPRTPASLSRRLVLCTAARRSPETQAGPAQPQLRSLRSRAAPLSPRQPPTASSAPAALPDRQPCPGLPSPPPAEARPSLGGGLSGERCQPRRPPGRSSWEARRGSGGDPSLSGPHSLQALMWARSAGAPRGPGERPCSHSGPRFQPQPPSTAPSGTGRVWGSLARVWREHRNGWDGSVALPRGLTPRAPQAARRAPAFSPTSPSRTQQCRVSAPAPLCLGLG